MENLKNKLNKIEMLIVLNDLKEYFESGVCGNQDIRINSLDFCINYFLKNDPDFKNLSLDSLINQFYN